MVTLRAWFCDQCSFVAVMGTEVWLYRRQLLTEGTERNGTERNGTEQRNTASPSTRSNEFPTDIPEGKQFAFIAESLKSLHSETNTQIARRGGDSQLISTNTRSASTVTFRPRHGSTLRLANGLHGLYCYAVRGMPDVSENSVASIWKKNNQET
jgi:hypothetical protein